MEEDRGEGRGADRRAWVTVDQAAQMLEMSREGARNLLHREGVAERQVTPNPNGGGQIAEFARGAVSKLADKRRYEATMKAQGFLWCGICHRWRAKELFPKHLKGGCNACLAKKARDERRAARWGDMHRKVETYGVRIEDVFAPSRPARAMDSLKYACMDEGFRHRGVPPGQTKRQAFCAKCMADRCVHYQDQGLTPAQVMKLPRPPTRYPEHRVQDYAEVG